MSVVKEIKFLAIARRSDKAILATRVHSSDKSYDYVTNVSKVLSSPGWASVTTDKLSLEDGPNMFYVLIDEAGRVYIAITSKAYPSRYIYGTPDRTTRGVLGELKLAVTEKFAEVSLSCGANGLDSKARTLLKTLCDEFNDLNKVDKLAAVQAKVDEVAGVMSRNIDMALKNTDRIEDIDDKAVRLADSANTFRSSANAVKRTMQCRYWKMVLLFTLLVIVILVVIIVPLVYTRK